MPTMRGQMAVGDGKRGASGEGLTRERKERQRKGEKGRKEGAIQEKLSSPPLGKTGKQGGEAKRPLRAAPQPKVPVVRAIPPPAPAPPKAVMAAPPSATTRGGKMADGGGKEEGREEGSGERGCQTPHPQADPQVDNW